MKAHHIVTINIFTMCCQGRCYVEKFSEKTNILNKPNGCSNITFDQWILIIIREYSVLDFFIASIYINIAKVLEDTGKLNRIANMTRIELIKNMKIWMHWQKWKAAVDKGKFTHLILTANENALHVNVYYWIYDYD